MKSINLVKYIIDKYVKLLHILEYIANITACLYD